jgi:ribosomal protein S18 acetylase RimI-like enzyme
MMNIKMTKASSEQLKEFEEILVNSSLGEHYFQKKGSALNMIKEGLEYDNLYAAMDQNKCIGFMFYIENGVFHSFPYLHIIVVKDEYRGKGIGKYMLEYYERLSDSDKVFLLVGDFNSNAKRLYERMGYRQVGEIPGLYREGITEFIMMKEKCKQ